MNAPNNNLRVRIWDLGPTAPKAPVRPAMPKDLKPGSPEEMVAESEFKAALAVFERERDDFARMQRAFESWHALYGGPYQIEMWSVNALEAKLRDPDRYVDTLPKGKKPGRAHIENEKREREEHNQLQQLRDRDPQFGTKGVAAA